MILLKFNKEIKGDSKIAGHENWIAIDKIDFHINRHIGFSGLGADRRQEIAQISQMFLDKTTDIASADLFFQAIAGVSLGEAQIDFIDTVGEDGKVFLTIKLTDAIVCKYDFVGAGTRPTEQFAINFTKISFVYHKFTGGIASVGSEKTWNLMTNKEKLD